MQGISRRIAQLLLVTVTAALPGGHALAYPTMEARHPAGCHSHGPAAPSPAPPSYQCCVNGHHAAIPNASFSPRLMAAQPSHLDGDEGLPPHARECHHC